jgi:antitoxin FitA
MAMLTIRNLDPAMKERLRVRAAKHGHSMEAEARRILQTALQGPASPHGRETNMAEAIRRRFAPFGGVDDLEIPARVPVREPPRSAPRALTALKFSSAFVPCRTASAAWLWRTPRR